MTNVQPKSIIVIFGATGDLAKRKLFPSIFRLYKANKLSEDFAVVGVARRPWTNDELRENVKKSVSSFKNSDADIEKFASHFYYQPFDVTDVASYQELKSLT